MGLKSIQFLYFTLGLMATVVIFINSCEGDRSFYNPILDTPNINQYVYFHTDGFYYMTLPSCNDLYLYKSETLSDWRLAKRKIIYTRNETEVSYRKSEIHYLSGNWYIYFDGHNITAVPPHQMFVIRALNSDNPFGRYSDELRLTPATPQEDFDAIDGTIFELGSGSLYFIYAGYATPGTYPWKLFIAPMSNPTTISRPRTLIRDTMFTWDTAIYGPQILRENENGNQTFLVFTAYCGGVNCVGLMGIEDEKDPLVAANWWHYPNGTVFAILKIEHLNFLNVSIQCSNQQ